MARERLRGRSLAMGSSRVRRSARARPRGRPVRGSTFLLTAAVSLLRDPSDRVGHQWRDHYRRNTSWAPSGPFNTEDQVLDGFTRVVDDADLGPGPRTPYWAPGQRYLGGEVIGSAIELLDQHDLALPTSVLPPADDVGQLADAVLSRACRSTIVDQLHMAVEITDHHLTGALNLCWITTRFMARGADQRAYPTVPIDLARIQRWSHAIAPFPSADDGPNDAAGDTYYFWTTAFLAALYAHRNISGAAWLRLLEHGPSLMGFVRGSIVGQPVTADHTKAAAMGVHAGTLVARASRARVD